MKKLLVLFVCLSLFGVAAKAQYAPKQSQGPAPARMLLNLYAGYVFDDKFDSYYSDFDYYDGKIKGGFQWGIGLEFLLKQYYGLELLYLRQDTKAPISYYLNGPKYTEVDLGINYIMLGGCRHMPSSNGKVDGYGGLLLGMAIINADNPENGANSSATKFAWGARLGCNIWVTPKVGIKLQTMLLSITQGAGGGLYFGTGGVGAGVSTYSTIYQFGLGGGLAFRLGS